MNEAGTPERARHDGPADAAIWRIALDVTDSQAAASLALLSASEIARAQRFHRDADRRRWTVARAGLKTILADCTGLAPREIEIEAGDDGKPFLARPPATSSPTPHFNLGHSDGIALVAVHPSVPIGIDVERVRERQDLIRVAARVLNRNEQEALRELPGTARTRAFLRAWTRKEAIVKAMGAGLTYPVQSIEVSLSPGEPPRVERVDGNRDEARLWLLHDVETPREYVGCFALRCTES